MARKIMWDSLENGKIMWKSQGKNSGKKWQPWSNGCVVLQIEALTKTSCRGKICNDGCWVVFIMLSGRCHNHIGLHVTHFLTCKIKDLISFGVNKIEMFVWWRNFLSFLHPVILDSLVRWFIHTVKWCGTHQLRTVVEVSRGNLLSGLEFLYRW